VCVCYEGVFLEAECTEWNHTEYSGAENDVFIYANFANKVTRSINAVSTNSKQY